VISSFRLPDLVLGDAIKADTSGSRQAAQELKKSIQREMGVIGGGRGGGMGGALLAGAVAGGVGGQAATAGVVPAINRVANNWRTVALAIHQANRKIFAAAQAAASVGNIAEVTRLSDIMAGGHAGGLRAAQARYAASKAAGGATATAAAAAGGAAATAAAATSSRGILASLRSFRSIWHLIIGVLIVGTIMEAVKSLLPALDYIRKVRPQGRYGVFGEQADIMQATLRNVGVQWGLMIIQLLELDKVLAAFNDRLVQLGSLFGWIGENKGIAWLIKTLISANPNMQMLKFLNWIASQLPQGNGGIDLGAGGPGARLGGAALEGSVEAYRTIQGTLMRYAAETAKNTKEAAGALKQILNRAPAMGVVAG
jgi:hypothetical protein